MPNFICTTCGAQHAESERPPVACVICEDDRQYDKVYGAFWDTVIERDGKATVTWSAERYRRAISDQ